MRLQDQLINWPTSYQLINRSPLTISPDSYIVDAIILMSQKKARNQSLSGLNRYLQPNICNQPENSCILVVEAGYLLGIITAKDVVNIIATGIDLTKTKVAEVMVTALITLSQSHATDIFTAWSLLRHYQISYLPIVDNQGKLKGIVTDSDLLQAFNRDTIVGIKTALQQPKNNARKINGISCPIHNSVQTGMKHKSATSVPTNQELQQTRTQLQMVEEKLRQTHDELAKLVAENKLLQQKIIEYQKKEQLYCKQQEAALRESEAKFQHFAENIQSLIWWKDPQTREFLYINPAYEKIWGRSLSSLHEQPLSWMDAVHPADRDRVNQMLIQSLAGESTNIEYRILRPDGVMRWLWDRTFAMRDQQGNICSYAGIVEDITERKYIEESLRESEARLSLALEAAQMGIWDWNIQTNEILWSFSMGSLYGLPNGTLSLTPEEFLRLIHPEDQPAFTQAVTRTVQQGTKFIVEYRTVWPDSSIHWLNSTGQIYYGENGEPMRLTGTTRDISDRKYAQEALRESEELHRSVVTVMGEGIVLLQADGRIVACNLSAEKILGLTKAEILGRTCDDEIWQPIHEDGSSFPGEEHPAMITLRTGQPCTNVRMGIQKLNGQVIWISINSQPLFRDHEPTPYAVVTSFSDISDAYQQAILRKQAEEKIQEQAALLDIATDAILVRGLQNQILFWNQGAERLYGWQAQEAVGKNPDELLFKQPSPKIAVAIQKVIENGTWQGELNKVTKSGKEIIVESRWTLMQDDQGQPKSILIVDTDITQKKQLEEQFFRTQRLESLGTLAGGIAHDLNNVLTPILAAAQLLQLKLPQDQERYYQLMTIIENNAKRGADLVKQVLSFARGFQGERTIILIKHLISEMLLISKQTFPKSIEFVISVPDNLWAVSGDITQLHQVLMNLVVNARDAMPEGGKIKISAENRFIDEAYAQMNLEAAVGHYILLTVADNGFGMPPEVLDRIFEPFFTTKEIGMGTGLGLSTVRGIIKSHGGFINVSSKVGKGTKFKLYLPAVEGCQGLKTDNLTVPLGKGELILVVDDEAKILEIATIVLENYNYKVLTASNGIEALALYAQYKHQIKAVLMDMIMPEMDGMTAIRTLQKMNPQVQIIACSGFNPHEGLNDVVNAKVQLVLPKPFTAQDLLNSLQHVLNNQN